MVGCSASAIVHKRSWKMEKLNTAMYSIINFSPLMQRTDLFENSIR